MKQSFTISFLLFVLLINLSLAFSHEDVEQVLDHNDNPIFPGGKYYILPLIRGPPGGGVRLDKTGDSECPVTVLQAYGETIMGLPVKFVIPGISHGIIFTNTPIEIEFTKKPNCVESSKWLIFVDDTINKACIGIGGPKNYLGKQTLNGTFNIQKYGYAFGYKLEFCVKGSQICLDIGRYDNDEGGRRLSLTEHEAFDKERRLSLTQHEDFRVVFVDASSYEDGIVKSVV